MKINNSYNLRQHQFNAPKLRCNFNILNLLSVFFLNLKNLIRYVKRLTISIYFQANSFNFKLVVRDVETLQVVHHYQCLDAIQYFEVSRLSTLSEAKTFITGPLMICEYFQVSVLAHAVESPPLP